MLQPGCIRTAWSVRCGEGARGLRGCCAGSFLVAASSWIADGYFHPATATATATAASPLTMDSLAINHKFHQLSRMGVTIRSLLTSLVYEKGLRLHHSAASSVGAATNLMSNDCERVFEASGRKWHAGPPPTRRRSVQRKRLLRPRVNPKTFLTKRVLPLLIFADARFVLMTALSYSKASLYLHYMWASPLYVVIVLILVTLRLGQRTLHTPVHPPACARLNAVLADGVCG